MYMWTYFNLKYCGNKGVILRLCVDCIISWCFVCFQSSVIDSSASTLPQPLVTQPGSSNLPPEFHTLGQRPRPSYTSLPTRGHTPAWQPGSRVSYRPPGDSASYPLSGGSVTYPPPGVTSCCGGVVGRTGLHQHCCAHHLYVHFDGTAPCAVAGRHLVI